VASNGASPPAGCRTGGEPLLKYIGKVVNIPLTTGVVGNNYVLSGLAAFYVAGYRVPAALTPNAFDGYTPLPSNTDLPINPPQVGVWGWFVGPITPVGSPGSGGGTNRGPVQISLLS
jgi:hypothetical protein